MGNVHDTFYHLIDQRMMAGSEKQTILILCFFSQEMNIFKSHFPPLFFFFFPFFFNIFHVVIKSNSFFFKKKKKKSHPSFHFRFYTKQSTEHLFPKKKTALIFAWPNLLNKHISLAGSQKQTILILCFSSQEMIIFKSHFPPLFLFSLFFINIPM